MIPKQTRDGHPVRQGVGVMPGTADKMHILRHFPSLEAWQSMTGV